MEWRWQQPPVVEAELHLLHVDDLLQPPVAPQRATLAAGWRGERAGLRRRVPEESAGGECLFRWPTDSSSERRSFSEQLVCGDSGSPRLVLVIVSTASTFPSKHA
jgi:hypothetical protein